MTVQSLHLQGAGGVGMCGMAEVLGSQGLTISGCDLADNERTRRLSGLGMAIHRGHDPSHLEGVDALVVSAAISGDDPEVRAARELGLPVVRRAEMLAELMRGQLGVAVAGTHGKTTTTALVGHLLTEAGADPTVIVGGRARSNEAHARVGEGRLLVCEADEYDRSFLELGPQVAVITNIEPEHLDCYGDEKTLRNAFVSFANRTSVFGGLVVCADEPGAWEIRREVRRRVIGYGMAAEAEMRLEIVDLWATGTRFRVLRGRNPLGEVELSMPGTFNALNALAAITVGLELDLEFGALAEACSTFAGVARRFEIRGERDGVTVVDDYAHHPTELEAVFEATRQAMPGRQSGGGFSAPPLQSDPRFCRPSSPPLSSAPTSLWCCPSTRRASNPSRESARTWWWKRRNVSAHANVVGGICRSKKPWRRSRRLVKPGDVLLTLGAGDVDRIAERWLEEVS